MTDPMLVAIPNRPPLAVNEHGEFFDVVAGTTAFLLRRVTSGRPAIQYDRTGMPATVPLHATKQDVIQLVNRVCTLRLYALDLEGNEIPDAPVGFIEITPEDIGEETDMHWMRLDRVFDALERSMVAMESKDLLIANTMKSLIESHTALQSGAVRMLDTATNTINVANGVSRPDLNFSRLGEELYTTVKDAESDKPKEQASFAVQLLNGGFGQAILSVVCRWAGISIPEPDEYGTEEVTA